MTEHRIGTREEWLEARMALLEREKELTRQGDEVTRQRQELPWVRVDKEYVFETNAGPKTLAELFDGRSQLVVYHFMHGPDTPDGCLGCSYAGDNFQGADLHLAPHDVTFVFASRSPLATLNAYKERMGWPTEWVSHADNDFNYDYGLAGVADIDLEAMGMELMAFSVFALEDGVVYHTYSTFDRGTEALNPTWQILDRTPKGRDHASENWPRRHDEYETAIA